MNPGYHWGNVLDPSQASDDWYWVSLLGQGVMRSAADCPTLKAAALTTSWRSLAFSVSCSLLVAYPPFLADASLR